MQGRGTTSGSVEGGGIYRELVTRGSAAGRDPSPTPVRATIGRRDRLETRRADAQSAFAPDSLTTLPSVAVSALITAAN